MCLMCLPSALHGCTATSEFNLQSHLLMIDLKVSTALYPRRTETQSPETLPHPYCSIKTKGSRASQCTLPGKPTGSLSKQWLTEQLLTPKWKDTEVTSLVSRQKSMFYVRYFRQNPKIQQLCLVLSFSLPLNIWSSNTPLSLNHHNFMHENLPSKIFSKGTRTAVKNYHNLCNVKTHEI